jgi:hypothetical protein
MKTVCESYVSREVWDVEDEYLVVAAFQVMEEDGWREGDRVRVTIEKIDAGKEVGE